MRDGDLYFLEYRKTDAIRLQIEARKDVQMMSKLPYNRGVTGLRGVRGEVNKEPLPRRVERRAVQHRDLGGHSEAPNLKLLNMP